jgi:hypothetical protein
MALGILSEALARVEHKLDVLLKFLGAFGTPMHFPGQTCPLCKNVIDYQVNIMKNVVVRKCGCTSGKQPMSIPLTPLGDNNATSTTTRNTGTTGQEFDSEFSSSRKTR